MNRTVSASVHVGAVMLLLALGGCTSRDAELQQFLDQVRREPASGVQPLPEVPEYESFVYEAQSLRSPFVPGGAASAGSAQRPDSRRNREYLEQFSLDTLKMVGTLRVSGRLYGLLQTREGLVHRVLPGHHVGQNDGKITEITPNKISVTEVVPDGLGGYMERPAAIGLND
ncbi:MAG: hypothetical protein RL026_1842 [Pseudomonadota bacterium]|jgi:type IV pilus assembly protein PilP